MLIDAGAVQALDASSTAALESQDLGLWCWELVIVIYWMLYHSWHSADASGPLAEVLARLHVNLMLKKTSTKTWWPSLNDR
jgi:hypothetical protein